MKKNITTTLVDGRFQADLQSFYGDGLTKWIVSIGKKVFFCTIYSDGDVYFRKNVIVGDELDAIMRLRKKILAKSKIKS